MKIPHKTLATIAMAPALLFLAACGSSSDEVDDTKPQPVTKPAASAYQEAWPLANAAVGEAMSDDFVSIDRLNKQVAESYEGGHFIEFTSGDDPSQGDLKWCFVTDRSVYVAGDWTVESMDDDGPLKTLMGPAVSGADSCSYEESEAVVVGEHWTNKWIKGANLMGEVQVAAPNEPEKVASSAAVSDVKQFAVTTEIFATDNGSYPADLESALTGFEAESGVFTGDNALLLYTSTKGTESNDLGTFGACVGSETTGAWAYYDSTVGGITGKGVVDPATVRLIDECKSAAGDED